MTNMHIAPLPKKAMMFATIINALMCAGCILISSCSGGHLYAQQEGQTPAEPLSEGAEKLLRLATSILAEPGHETKNAWQFRVQVDDVKSLSIQERELIAEALFDVLEKSDKHHVRSSIYDSMSFLMPLGESYVTHLTELLDGELPVGANFIYSALAKVYAQSPRASEFLLETVENESGMRRKHALHSLAFVATPDEELVDLALSELEHQRGEPLAAFLILNKVGDLSETVREDVEASVRKILADEAYEAESRMQALRTLSTIFAESEDRRVELLTTAAVDEHLPLVVRQEALRLMRVDWDRIPVFADAIDLDTVGVEDPLWKELYAFVKGRQFDEGVGEGPGHSETDSAEPGG